MENEDVNIQMLAQQALDRISHHAHLEHHRRAELVTYR